MGVTLFYNADCPNCARQAKRTARLDWLSRVRISTDDSPIGPVPRGEIVVADDESQRVFTGFYATRARLRLWAGRRPPQGLLNPALVLNPAGASRPRLGCLVALVTESGVVVLKPVAHRVRVESDENPKRKHHWDKDHAGFVEVGPNRVGKCPATMNPSDAQALLDDAIPYCHPRWSRPYPQRLYECEEPVFLARGTGQHD